jgi:hypothetical protein
MKPAYFIKIRKIPQSRETFAELFSRTSILNRTLCGAGGFS